jgi:predicted nucleic acid-binding protein
MIYLLDTNVVSELVRPRPDPRVRAWLASLDEVALSVISIEELVFGIERAPAARRQKLAAWFDDLVDNLVTVEEITPVIARAAGELRARRTRAGRPVTQADMLIAATALIRGWTLATRNVPDFEDCGVLLFNPFAS